VRLAAGSREGECDRDDRQRDRQSDDDARRPGSGRRLLDGVAAASFSSSDEFMVEA
jgi:hypothetical protein